MARTRGYATLTTKRRLLGDLNGDDVVDAADFAALSVCLTGPGIAVSGGCEGADLDLTLTQTWRISRRFRCVLESQSESQALSTSDL